MNITIPDPKFSEGQPIITPDGAGIIVLVYECEITVAADGDIFNGGWTYCVEYPDGGSDFYDEIELKAPE